MALTMEHDCLVKQNKKDIADWEKKYEQVVKDLTAELTVDTERKEKLLVLEIRILEQTITK